MDVLKKSTQRLSLTENRVVDAGICHGSAGIALIYYRLYIETQMREFNEATNHWLKQTINFSKYEDGLAGYKTSLIDELKCDYSLLTGISGIGLALISCIEKGNQEWDEMLLLS